MPHKHIFVQQKDKRKNKNIQELAGNRQQHINKCSDKIIIKDHNKNEKKKNTKPSYRLTTK